MRPTAFARHARRVRHKVARGRPRLVLEHCSYDPCDLIIDRTRPMNGARAVFCGKLRNGRFTRDLLETLNALHGAQSTTLPTVIAALDRDAPDHCPVVDAAVAEWRATSAGDAHAACDASGGVGASATAVSTLAANDLAHDPLPF